LSESYRSNPTDFEVTLGLALLNVLYVGMGLAAAWSLPHEPWSLADRGVHPHSHSIPHTTANLRAALRLVCFPALLAMGAQLFPAFANKGDQPRNSYRLTRTR